MLSDLLKNPAASEGRLENEAQGPNFVVCVPSAILHGLT